MKKQVIAIILIFLLTLACSNGADWAAQVDGKKISMKDFNRFYYTQNRIMLNLETNEEVDELAAQAETLSQQLQQMLVKQNFLDQLIAQKLIYNKAFSDKSIDREEMQALIDFTRYQAIASYYMAQKLKDKLEVSDEEVEEFYYANRQHFRGVPLNEEVVNTIRRQILMHKQQMETNQYLMDLITEARIDRKGLAAALQAEIDRKEREEEKDLKRELRRRGQEKAVEEPVESEETAN